MTAPLLEIRKLRTRFRTDRGDLDAVRDVSFTLRAGETLGLVGESGSGKSVTGFSIMGLIDPPGRILSGEILFRGQDLTKLDEEAMRRLRGNRIAMVFQDPMMTLNPVLRISTQMIETIRAHESIDDASARIRARDLLGTMGIPSPEARLDAYPHQLSGGMRQRVAIAIALINKPDLIIADEPTTALDVSIQAQILAEVQQLTRESGTALLWITHDLSVIAGIADEIAVMYAGRIVEHGGIDAVLDQPSHPYTAGLIGSLPGTSPPGSMLVQIPGTTPDMVDPPQGCAFGPRCSRRDDACERQPAFTESPHRLRCFHPLSGPASAAEVSA
ncbi:ABC transporter ATP-binding protein [Bosea sp. UC22_33]|uniref:ABC transporter ATP-binding protein n=1 Tax=Bosea sp. UC22_33 TaxID=3350165 RepID=UPI00366AE92C